MTPKPRFDEEEEFDPRAKKEDPKNQQPKRTLENEEALDCDWDDDSLKRRKDPLPRIRPDKGKAVRFALLPFIKPKNAQNHYIDKKGTFRCLSTPDKEAICCTSGQAGNPNLSIVALALKYTNCDPRSGKYEGRSKGAEIEWEIGFVNLSRSNYTQIGKLVEDEEESGKSESVYDFDIIMTHNETTGIGYTLSRASRSPRWVKDPEIAAAIKEAAEPFLDGKLLTAKLGRKLTENEWRAMLSTLSGETPDGGDGDDL